MGATVFFHNGFGDYVINRGALLRLAQSLPRPNRLIFGVGPHEFLVRDLPFDVLQPIVFSGPNAGAGRAFTNPSQPKGNWSQILVNLASWEGHSFGLLRQDLNPLQYVWNTAWNTWTPEGPNAVELAVASVQHLYPHIGLQEFRVPPKFDNKIAGIVDRIVHHTASNGYSKCIGVHLDSSEDKAWPAQEIADILCSLLTSNPEARVFVVGKHDRIPRCSCHATRYNFLKGISLEASMCAVAQMDVFFGVDSCMTKVADVVGIPTVALFANERDAARWGNFWTTGPNLRLSGHGANGLAEAAITFLSNALLGVHETPLQRLR